MQAGFRCNDEWAGAPIWEHTRQPWSGRPGNLTAQQESKLPALWRDN